MFLVWVLDRAWKWNLGCLNSIFDSVLCLRITYWPCHVSGSLSHILGGLRVTTSSLQTGVGTVVHSFLSWQ